MKQYHVGVAAEAFAAALFAQAGYDVSVQYGANQPEYDLLVSHENDMMKVSVKGSQDGGWGLVQSYKKGRTYHQAIDYWANRHCKRVIYCFVQFLGLKLGQMPRVYLATVQEIVKVMKATRAGNGNTTLEEKHHYKKGIAEDCTDVIPENWLFSQQRVKVLLRAKG